MRCIKFILIGLYSLSLILCVNIVHADSDDEEKDLDFGVPVADGVFVITQPPGGWYSHSYPNAKRPCALCVEAFDLAKTGGGGETPNGQAVAAEEGEIVFAANRGDWGNYVVIDHGDDIYTVYAHLASFAVKKGDNVKKGQLLGNIGRTGFGNGGAHLHFSFFDGNPLSGGKPENAKKYIDLEKEFHTTLKAKLLDATGKTIDWVVDLGEDAHDFFTAFLELFEPDEYGWNEDIIIPDEPDVEVGEIDYEPITKFISDLYVQALGIGGLIAMILIVYGGVRYTMSGSNPAIKSDAKEWIISALLGLLLLFSAYMLLQFISPCLVGSC
jgi:hypothetical protein